jgi:hypothetical protein
MPRFAAGVLVPLTYYVRELPSLQFSDDTGSTTMPKSFRIHDRVSWNSEAGRVSGTIIRVHTSDFDHMGYTHHASPDDPQYEIKSAKTDHIAFHKASALTKLVD